MADPGWIRSWPERIPAGRNYVVDGIERAVMDRNYVPVLRSLTCDTILVEWDLAVSAEDRARFAAIVEHDRDRVQVAPYRLYPVSTLLPGPVWAHRRGRHSLALSWISEGDSWCDWFGFGLIYLPLQVVRCYLASGEAWCTDASFSAWHQRHVGDLVPVHWDVRPVHLHY